MNQLIKTLSEYVNKEMQTYNYSIREYSLKRRTTYKQHISSIKDI